MKKLVFKGFLIGFNNRERSIIQYALTGSHSAHPKLSESDFERFHFKNKKDNITILLWYNFKPVWKDQLKPLFMAVRLVFAFVNIDKEYNHQELFEDLEKITKHAQSDNIPILTIINQSDVPTIEGPFSYAPVDSNTLKMFEENPMLITSYIKLSIAKLGGSYSQDPESTSFREEFRNKVISWFIEIQDVLNL